MEITIRKATVEDLPAVIELASESVIYSISPYRSLSEREAIKNREDDLKDLKSWIAEDWGGYIFVAQSEDKRICGHVIFAMGRFDITGKEIGWILDITVAPPFKGTGISQKLHEVAEILLQEKNMTGIGLTVTSSNKRAFNFYRKLGYEEEHSQLVKLL